ncbi:MarR family winged helix-turn-helix transcriptional regulator [uncultured Anaerovibrio sp.]|uniref:MarR family winged helix-turn-helix transcriptional regulator n=1 Tax=uncultured Anaerovibrio sp. TaxID=361586 RepID=UPI00260E0198|nr:MarR family winged helix-turn-helix transcriptional regulator [uncultured Anaerovibrio sp.]
MLSFKDIPCYYLKLRWAEMLSRKFYNKRMQDCGITGRQFTLLFIIKYNGGSSLSELGDMMNLDRSTINRSIQPLLKKGLLEDRKAEGQRNSSIWLTKRGEEVFNESSKSWNKAQEDFARLYTKEELEKFDSTLELLKRLEED